MCEITCIDIKASTNDSLKCLVFKFSKNDKADKKKVDDINNIMGNFEDPHIETGYDQFKQVSVDESRDDQDFSPDLRPGHRNPGTENK